MLAAKEQDPSVPVDANGKWTGGEKILTIATNADPGKQTAEVAPGPDAEAGLQAQLPQGPAGHAVHEVLRRAEGEVAICPNVGWFKDFTDPQSMLEPTFNGKDIKPQGNVNWPQLNVPAINDAMKAASSPGRPRAATRRGPKINHMIVEQAPAIPYIWDKTRSRLEGHPGGDERLLHRPGPELHVAQVGERDGLAHT